MVLIRGHHTITRLETHRCTSLTLEGSHVRQGQDLLSRSNRNEGRELLSTAKLAVSRYTDATQRCSYVLFATMYREGLEEEDHLLQETL